MTTLTATFDGLVFKPDTKPDLSPNTKVRIIIDSEPEAKPRSKWAEAAKFHRENAGLTGKSEQVNEAIRHFRDEFVV